ncbi:MULTISPECIES: LuxR C-terminal-related transcriptional regulator [unclassified Microcella]|uniref:helix-turn-helix transcriptional regulator n=1 Tax=unclassified Microcella TaxID=2630066 RepID=UPI0006F61262|nr:MULTISPECIES: LuxR C-terminal-related transcriptional regulator [unclassified Microcella]KQV26286.1 hypothetical protein ASC54_05135 [Yonghaparkia sp. Root332]KRF32930.1 hypothetical protein ASG83_02610 [Yonghaparkia sp. Soil809]
MRESDLLDCLAELARICANRPDRASFACSLVLQVLRPFEARAAGVGIVDGQGYLDMRTMYGFPAGALRDGPRYLLDDDYPLPDAVRRGVAIEGTLDDLVDRYPAIGPLELRGRHMLLTPLLFRGATIGGMAILMDAAPRHEENRVFWSAVADLVSATISSDDPAPVAPRDRQRRSAPLSARQREILGHMQQGRTNGQIARAMNFGTSTIGHDIMRIFDALGVESRREAVAAAERAGILAPREQPSL